MSDTHQDTEPASHPTKEVFHSRLSMALRLALILGIVFFGLLRLVNLTFDFPPELSWDGDAYSDEGLYSHDAVSRVREGAFHIPLDFNQFVALPLMPLVKAAFFAAFGPNLFSARMVSVIFSLGLGWALYYLVRRWEDHWTALLAVLILAMNHIVFAFSRLAIDEVTLAFFVTLSLAFAVRVRGEKWWFFAILTSVSFACALMTKTTSIFVVPLIAAAVILQEVDLRRIALKFAVCSAVFFALVGAWYLLLIFRYTVDFHYFFTVNVDVAISNTLQRWTEKLVRHAHLALNAEPIIPLGLIVLSPIIAIFSRPFRRHPLLYLSIAWLFLYLVLFAYYGRIYPRFFVILIPPISIWAVIALKFCWELQGLRRLPAYLLAGVLLLSSLWQAERTLHLATYRVDTFNEMAQDIQRVIDSDPSGNRVIMGHTASNIALRTSLIARNDRYSPHPMDQRIEAFIPGWAISEGEFRVFPADPFYRHAEYYDLYFDIELVASYDTHDNYRGHKMHLYKLTPREVTELPLFTAHAVLESVEERRPIHPVARTPDTDEPIGLLGHDWELVSEPAPFGERYIHRGAVLGDRMYLSGGFNHEVLFMGDVWSSRNGADWRQDTEKAPWPARFAHGMAALDRFLYIVGGYNGTLLNDVWRSTDGSQWELVTESAPWDPRSDFQLVVHDGAIFLLGGRAHGRRLSDVWKTTDGADWTLLTASAWPERSHFSAASHRGQLVIAGGVDFDFEAGRHEYRRDIWSSIDGSDWRLLTDRANFRGRALMQMVSLGPTLFALGGDDMPELAVMRRDTWISTDAIGWWRLVATDTHGQRPHIDYETRINHVILGKDDALYLIGGHRYDVGRFHGINRYEKWRNDNVWKSTGEHVFPDDP